MARHSNYIDHRRRFYASKMALFALPLFAAIATHADVAGQEVESKQPAPLSIQIEDVQLVNMSGLSSINGQFSLKLRVRNESPDPLSLQISQFQFECGGKILHCNSAVRNPILTGPCELQPGDEAEGMMGLNLNYPSADEPRMDLLCKLDDDILLRISVNDALHKLTRLTTRLLGPEDSLAIVQIHRSVDKLSIGALTGEFQRLQKDGIQRVILDVKESSKSRTPAYTTRMAISGWLGSVKKGYTPRRFSLGEPIRCSVQFNDFFVTGMGHRDPSGSSYGSENIYYSTVDQAIAVALKSEYEGMPLESAIADMQHSEPGIRRIAIEANIDRLSEAQLDAILKDAPSRSPAHQALVAGNLYRVSVPMAVSTLETLVQNANTEVSQAALKSLVRSVSPSSVQALKHVWHESYGNSGLRRDIVSAVKEAGDYRYADLLEEYAKEMILSSVAFEVSESKRSPKNSATESSLPGSSSASSGANAFQLPTSQARYLKSVLDFLKEQDNSGVAVTAKSELLRIADLEVQDVVFEFLTNAEAGSELNSIARSYIRSRLKKNESSGDGLTEGQERKLEDKYGPKGRKRLKKITSTLLNAIRRFPDSIYTSRLVELASFEGISSTLRRNCFQVATLCATDSQLRKLIGDFNKLDRYGRDHLLKQMSALGHPDWLPLAKKCLSQDESTQFIAIAILSQNQSVEAMNVLIERLSQLIDETESEAAVTGQGSPDASTHSDQGDDGKAVAAATFPGKSDLSAQSKRLVEKLLNSLRSSKLPEARRMINRCERSSSLKLYELAVKAAQNEFRSDPNAAALASAARLRRSKQYDLAMKAYDTILQSDPFCSSAYASRSSLYLRTGEPELAMKDLKQALELEPEDVLIESLIALAEVRLGRAKEGIEQMESIVKSIPDLPTIVRRDALYNLACTYGRSIEVEKDEATRKQYMARAMEVFHDCVHREEGFDDPLHIQNDPDMNVFRTHPDWADLIAKVELNETEARNKR